MECIAFVQILQIINLLFCKIHSCIFANKDGDLLVDMVRMNVIITVEKSFLYCK